MPYRPSQDLFIDRLSHLVRRDGLEGVGGSYGVRPQTVQNWLRERTTPSAATMRSVTSRGLRITGPSRTVRNPETGLFESSIISGHAAKAIDSINRERRENMRAAMDAATNDRQRQMARSIGEPLTRQEEQALDSRLRRLNRETALFGEDIPEGSQLSFDWRRFDRDYTLMQSGQQPTEEWRETDELLEELAPTQARRTRFRRTAYVVTRGRSREVFQGPRGGFYYRSPSGYKVYVKGSRVNEKDRVVPE